ncbi:flagellar hook-associated protein FlgL [Shewanella sp. Isolate11]|uniref:flagellar hook-associated protein FlgL n=1 Tax=Shewanella sp. Isolate11 TaxID=2908530 RepID=UPI001EFC3566|nr:flagellar hook-associated protein FlgL [Shewanella sp. Isolate11]MCG9697164.1 flagellar hook-associated protein FlgL [Shewanella sp. Isolate11]
MRISTAQMYHQNLSQVLDKQSATSKVMEQIASGKRVNTAGDDPVAAIGIDNLNKKNELVDQFIKNIDYATYRLSLAESELGSAHSLVTTMKDQLLSAMNGAMDSSDRQSIANDIQSNLEALLKVANSQDESGNYIFAGNKTGSQPFTLDSSGQVIYNGDTGVRQSIVASGVTVGTNFPGDKVFLKTPNPLGDFGVNYLPGQSGDIYISSAKITDSGSHVALSPEQYTFNFVDNGTGGIDLQVVDSASNVQTFTNYDSASPVSFNGIEVTIEGTPQPGDSFTMSPQSEVDVFDTINQIITLLNDPSTINSPQGDSQLAQLLNQIDSSAKQIDSNRGVAGNDLKQIDKYQSAHTDEKLINTSALSMLEDLDLAEAITELEKQQVALNAVSSVFSKVGSTSLFDYL